jgi:protein-disulfide isomerase
VNTPKSTLDTVLSIILTACAVVLVATFVLRGSSWWQGTNPGADGVAAHQYIEDLGPLFAHGVSSSAQKRPLELIQFLDLECPACRTFHSTVVSDAVRSYGDDLRVTVVHFPLTGRRLSRPAAYAAECTRQHGLFLPMVDAIFEGHQGLGVRSWGSFAQEAGVVDLQAYGRCLDADSTSIWERIDGSRSVGASIGVRATPTVILNGWRFATPPSLEQLVAAVDSIRLGVPPFQVQDTIWAVDPSALVRSEASQDGR